ncbi:hypothetical protein Btru_018822 [Bulinus truncatus]|nr:hypothetical protein Btru_018822 [Bulinus truncatus]
MWRTCGSQHLLCYCLTLHLLIVVADVLCPAPVNVVETNTSLEVDGRPDGYLLISCSRGCCPESSDGCCYRNTEDVVVYTVPVSILLALIVVILCCIFKRLRDNRRRDQSHQDKAASDALQDNPPSYSACVHPVSSTSTLALGEVHETVEIVIHPPPVEEENAALEDPPPPPPVYDDIFKYGEEDQVTVVSPNGRVSFVDLTLLPAIKSSLSSNDLHGKMGQSRGSSTSIRSLGHLPYSFKPEATIEMNDSDKNVNDDRGVSGGDVQKEEERVFFSLGCTDSFRSTRGDSEQSSQGISTNET